MIEIDIPSIDPMQHESKIFLGLTGRQCLCIVPGVAIGAGLFALTYNIMLELGIVLIGVAVVPAVCMGWWKPYNMKCEQYLKLLWYNNFVASPKRILKSDEAEVKPLMTIKDRMEAEKKQKEKDLNEKKKKQEKEKENKTRKEK